MVSLRYMAAFLSIAVLALLAALPWGLPPEDRFFLPLLPVVAIHFWCLRHPGVVPEWYVFVVGLCLDGLTQGPLGYWPLVYLAAYVIGTFSAPLAGQGRGARLVLFLAALVLVTALAWVVASIYFLEFAEVGPFATGALLAAMAAVVLLPLLRVIDPDPGTRDNTRLERGV